jgi:predicted ATPase/class 3 adenylate cyclase/DNA-binding CsgD family transcriptional regulator
MFAVRAHRMLANMSEPQADTAVNWSDLGVTELPTGTVTLLLADVEGSTRLWQTQPEEMTAAIAMLDRLLCDVISAHQGVRPVEQGEGDSFVVAFARASDAVACALELQRAPLAPIRLRIGVHTGEVLLRDEGNYIGPTVNRAARLRDLAHGGQTVLSGTTNDLVVDGLTADAWLIDLGSHELRDLPRAERVVQLCHPDLHNEFPPLRTGETAVAQRLPAQFSSFVGRETEIDHLVRVLAENKLVTLTGAGGIGKTRLAIEVAAKIEGEFGSGAWYVDLAPITDPALVPVTVARALGLPDQPGRGTTDALVRLIGDGQMLLVLDNCEHLLDASAALIVGMLGGCPALTLVATSREPIGVTGEVSWRVPSLPLDDEAIELFTERARQVRPDFSLTDDNAASVAEICARLDGVPLAIELAATRVRVMSPTAIAASLHDRFRLLTGGARTAVRRQQTLRASVDWSHALLTEPERVVFRRLATFRGGFDLDAAEAVAGGIDVERYQVLDLLTLLVDKSLVVAECTSGPTRYRLLETMRQYALEKLGESGESDTVRTRHRDHYTAMAALLDTPASRDYGRRLGQADDEIDNLRAAFTWSRETADIATALRLASALYPLWASRGRLQEGLAWFDAALTAADAQPADVAPAIRARALADNVTLNRHAGAMDSMDQAHQALEIAREVDDPALLVRALTGCGAVACYDPEVARPYFAEAIDLARSIGDRWRLSEILVWQAFGAIMTGDPIAAVAAAEENRDLAEAIGNGSALRGSRWCVGVAKGMTDDMSAAVAQLREVVAQADAAHDVLWKCVAQSLQALMLAYHGDSSAARAAANAAIDDAVELGGFFPGIAYGALIAANVAAGDLAATDDAIAAGWHHVIFQPKMAAIWLVYRAHAALTRGEITEARRWADDAVAATRGFHQSLALTTRAGVAIMQGEREQADRDAHDALAIAARTRAYGATADTLECLALLALGAGSHPEAARLYGAADAIRQRGGWVRFTALNAIYEAAVAALRDAMDEKDFESAWAEGAALSTAEAIGYARRGHGKRKRPASGWAALTPTERDVVRLVSKGLGNNDIATRLFVSPRTVQTHLTHVYAKLGLTSRVQLAQEAARYG